MISQPTIPPDGISAINDLYLENFYLNNDKISLEFEVERLKISLGLCKSDLELYKSILKEYQNLYNEATYGRKI